MNVIRIRPSDDRGNGGLILKSFTEIEEQLGDLKDMGEEEYLITIEKMSKKEFKNLPEWTGF
jgi:hypothetical protein